MIILGSLSRYLSIGDVYSVLSRTMRTRLLTGQQMMVGRFVRSLNRLPASIHPSLQVIAQVLRKPLSADSVSQSNRFWDTTRLYFQLRIINAPIRRLQEH